MRICRFSKLLRPRWASVWPFLTVSGMKLLPCGALGHIMPRTRLYAAQISHHSCSFHTHPGLTLLNNLSTLVLALGGKPGGQVVLVSLFSVANAIGECVGKSAALQALLTSTLGAVTCKNNRGEQGCLQRCYFGDQKQRNSRTFCGVW